MTASAIFPDGEAAAAFVAAVDAMAREGAAEEASRELDCALSALEEAGHPVARECRESEDIRPYLATLEESWSETLDPLDHDALLIGGAVLALRTGQKLAEDVPEEEPMVSIPALRRRLNGVPASDMALQPVAVAPRLSLVGRLFSRKRAA
jgi:hypothetical protein